MHTSDGGKGQVCLSPNVGQFKLTNPSVRFNLRVTRDQKRVWEFEVTLLSDVRVQLPVERYAWVRLGMPSIENIGKAFVDEIGRDQCIWRFT